MLPEAASIRRALLAWYSQSKRDLPWRRTNDPYPIWVSEIMLQQTRVAAVLPYYERFLRRFPSVLDLANAPAQDVLTSWAGLGYYSRARNLHKAAKAIAAAGAFPREHPAIRLLPGVGDYTAAAIASIAFNLPYAALDGNAFRVLSRLTAEPGDIGAAQTRSKLGAVAGELLDRRRPGDFNQAVMELGATICLPKTPLCGSCPLRRNCEAFRSGNPGEYPMKLRKVQRRDVADTLFYVERDGHVLFWQRKAGSKRLAGFWELPGPTQLAAADDRECIGEFRHTIVNTTYRFNVVRASVAIVPGELVWLSKSFFDEVPLSTTAKKAISCLAKYEPAVSAVRGMGAG